MEKSVDIVIVNYNTKEYLRDCIESIHRNTRYPYRLIIIDNQSTDGSLNYLRELRRQGHRVLFNRENLGCAKAWNQGIRLGQGEYILLLNPDTLLTSGWLTQMVACAESDPQIAVVGNKQVDQRGRILHAGLVEEAGKAVFRGAGERDQPGKFAQVCDCIDVCGACYLIKRQLLAKIGYFDERFFLYAEETDYSLRARKLGYRVVYCPVTITHFKDGAPISPEERQRLHQQSCRLFDEKWFEGGE